MKWTIPLIGLLMISFSDCEKGSEPEPVPVVAERISGPEADVSAILAAGENMLEALRQEDLDRLREGFSGDAVIIPQGHPVLRGKAAIRVFYRAQFDEYDIQEFGPSIDELVVCGSWAFSRGTGVFLAKSTKHDETIHGFTRGMEIWNQQDDGSWKVARAVGNR